MNHTEDFSLRMEQLVRECEAALDKYLPDPDSMPAGEAPAATAARAMRYSVMAGGKRLRPLLIARISDLYGGRRALAEPFMAALEMIHSYSLVHDDLPAMDDDEYRRGRKTTHIVFGEGMAVLAGDGLLNFAYETALTAFDAARTPAETAAVVRALRILSGNAGIYGMVGGQCADLEAENRGQEITGETLEYIHSHKTACMIRSAFQIGAVLAGAPESDIERLGNIAVRIGIAFQIQDDVLDVTGDSEELGKPTGSDEQEGKSTYVSLYGIEKAVEKVRLLTDEALADYESLTVRDDFLRALLEQLVSRRK
ncbi:MAG: polyprenyl synthetase family protein [Eubacteriales bacterium]|nr:polyprenyl synthetase family protein [Eubacteriales bacterium]